MPITFENEYEKYWLCRSASYEDTIYFIWGEVFAVLYIIELIQALTKSDWFPEQVKIQHVDDEIIRSINIKSLYSITSHGQLEVFETIVRNIVTFVTSDVKNVVFSVLRDYIYDLFVYDVNVHLCMWSFLSTLINESYIDDQNIDACIEHTFELFKLYNNNYRPIYHVESYLYKIMSLLHKHDNTMVSPLTEQEVIKDIDTSEHDM